MAIKHTAVLSVKDYEASGHVPASDWNASHTIEDGTITDTHVAAANKDGVAGTASMRTLGTGAQQAAAGNHTHDGNDVATVANNNVDGGVPVVHLINVPAGTNGNVDVVVTDKIEILDISVQKRAAAGGAADTITVQNAANPITAALDMNVADKTIVRPTTIDDAFSTINAGGTLRIAAVNGGGGTNGALVTVLGVRRA